MLLILSLQGIEAKWLAMGGRIPPPPPLIQLARGVSNYAIVFLEGHMEEFMKIIEVTAALIEKDGKFLIARRKPGKHLEGKWEFPGGKIEGLETPEECLRRELREEFEIETKVGEFVAESVFEYETIRVRLLGYRVEYISGEFRLNDHDKIEWIHPSEFDTCDLAPADIPIAQKLIASLL